MVGAWSLSSTDAIRHYKYQISIKCRRQLLAVILKFLYSMGISVRVFSVSRVPRLRDSRTISELH